MKAMMVTIKLH